MRVVAISDTHTRENELTLPEADVLIFAGDFHITSMHELKQANRWFAKQPAKYKIFVAGNHDTILESLPLAIIKESLSSVIYLQNESVTIENKKFYGCPYSPEFNNWAFMYTRNSIEGKEIWSQIPENVDFLITHCPPYGILDRNLQDIRCGCEILQREIAKKFPLHHIFGHIHMNGGRSVSSGGSSFYNVSVCDEEYKLTNRPTVIEV